MSANDFDRAMALHALEAVITADERDDREWACADADALRRDVRRDEQSFDDADESEDD